MESRIVLRAESRPVHQVEIDLPTGYVLKDLNAPGVFQSASTSRENGSTRLVVYLGSGQTGEFSIVLHGELPGPSQSDDDQDAPLTVELPRLVVNNVTDQESTIVVQTDPSYDARAQQLQNCQQVLLERAYGWLTSTQRGFARLAIHASSVDFDGSISLRKRAPRILCRPVSNLRVTPRAFEETILLDFTIKDAGTREVAFLLPADLREARISAPLLRRKTIEDVSAEQIRVRLDLQDEVMGQLRVLVENDRLITTEERSVPIPIIENVRVEAQFVALESAGRDEVVVARTNEIEPLGRQQRQWQLLAGLLAA